MPSRKKSTRKKRTQSTRKKSTKKTTRKTSKKIFRRGFRAENGATIIQRLFQVCHAQHESVMARMKQARSEIGGKITTNYEFVKETIGDRIQIGPGCEGGFLADWHAHPPRSVLLAPKDDIYFLPPSEADLYQMLNRAFVGFDRYSVVFSIEGIYIAFATDDAIDKMLIEMYNNMINEQEIIQNDCPFVLAPQASETGFTGFQKDQKFPFLSEAFGSGTLTKILNESMSFESALDAYKTWCKTFGIHVYFEKA